jgi:hypothetical protein
MIAMCQKPCVFGGTDTRTKQCFLVAVKHRNADTPLGIIKARVKRGTTIVSDCWKVYDTPSLEAAGYKHFEKSLKITKNSKNLIFNVRRGLKLVVLDP